MYFEILQHMLYLNVFEPNRNIFDVLFINRCLMSSNREEMLLDYCAT